MSVNNQKAHSVLKCFRFALSGFVVLKQFSYIFWVCRPLLILLHLYFRTGSNGKKKERHPPNFFFLSTFRPVYVSTVRPQSKHIVVIVDHGASVTETQLQIAKDAAQVILNSIDEHDKVI